MSGARRALVLGGAVLAVAGCAGGGRRGGPRVVCVSKQINEFLYDIGADSVLVGRDLTSVYPPQIGAVASVGYHRALSAEGIISLRPTLLLTDGNFGPEAVAAQVAKVGIPIDTLLPGATTESAQALMTRLGQMFGHQRQADSVVAAWRTDMARVLADSARWSGGAKPRVLIMHFGQIANDYLGLKRGSTADQILQWAGGVNAIDSVGGMLRLTPELIAKAAPDIIIATEVGFDRIGSAEKFAALPGVSLTPAGKNKRIYRIEEDKVMYLGPRTPGAVEEVAGWLHPPHPPGAASSR